MPLGVAGGVAKMGEVDADRGEDAVIFTFDVGVEEQVGRCRTGEPGVLGDLAFELPRTPPRIPERHQRLARTAAGGYGAQYVDRRGEADVVRHRQGRFNGIVAGMQHETTAAVDRAAVANDEVARLAR